MPFIPTANGVEVALRATQNGIPIVNVFHVHNGSAPSTTDLQDIADIFETWWTTHMLAALHPSYVLNEIVAKDITVANGPEVVNALTTGNAGTATGQPMAANAAVVISWRTALTGRSFRGRTYQGGLPNNLLDDAQNVSVGAAAAFLVQYQELVDALVAAGKYLAVLSKYANLVLRVAGLLTEIITIIVDTKVDSQRRRNAN